MREMQTIAIFNQKGGVAKTTTTLALAEVLSSKGKSILLVDLDPQASLSFIVSHANDKDVYVEDIMKRYIEDDMSYVSEAINAGDLFDYVKSTLKLSKLALELTGVLSAEKILDSILGPIKTQYDYILIDTSPSLSLLSYNSLYAADECLIPAVADRLCLQSIDLSLETIHNFKRRVNHEVNVLGILFTCFDQRLKLTREIVGLVEETYLKFIKVFKTKIRKSVKAQEAIQYSCSVNTFAPDSNTAIDYEAFVEEMLNE